MSPMLAAIMSRMLAPIMSPILVPIMNLMLAAIMSLMLAPMSSLLTPIMNPMITLISWSTLIFTSTVSKRVFLRSLRLGREALQKPYFRAPQAHIEEALLIAHKNLYRTTIFMGYANIAIMIISKDIKKEEEKKTENTKK